MSNSVSNPVDLYVNALTQTIDYVYLDTTFEYFAQMLNIPIPYSISNVIDTKLPFPRPALLYMPLG